MYVCMYVIYITSVLRPPENYVFRHELNQRQEVIDYVDIGASFVMSLEELIREKDNFVDAEGFLTLRCTLDALPIPPSIKHGHDSKAKTGMVGLENLGATCYLNALLQVCVCVCVCVRV